MAMAIIACLLNRVYVIITKVEFTFYIFKELQATFISGNCLRTYLLEKILLKKFRLSHSYLYKTKVEDYLTVNGPRIDHSIKRFLCFNSSSQTAIHVLTLIMVELCSPGVDFIKPKGQNLYYKMRKHFWRFHSSIS